MTDLKPLTPLGYAAAHRRELHPFVLSETPEMGLASIAIAKHGQYPRVFGLVLPGPGRWAKSDSISAFWTGPGQWMIEQDGRGDDGLGHDLQDQLPGVAITEQTDGWAAFEVKSSLGDELIERLLEKLVNIDPSQFAVGCATRTGLEHMSVFVIRKAPDLLAVLGMRSAAGSLWHALETTAEGFSEKLA